MTAPLAATMPAAGQDAPPPQPLYGSVEAWVTGFFLPIFKRPLGGEYRWCREWWQHAEAITRLTALWHSWEALRLQPGTGMASWLRDHLDHHLPVLMGRTGPFAQCNEDEHIEPREAKVGHAPPRMVGHRRRRASRSCSLGQRDGTRRAGRTVVDKGLTYPLDEGVACSLARTAYLAARLLQSHMDPQSSGRWELTPGGHAELLQLVSDALGMLGSCVSKISGSIEGDARERLVRAALYTLQASHEVTMANEVIKATADSGPRTGPGPRAVNEPALLASKSFGEPGLSDVMQLAGMIPASPPASARTRSAGLTPGAAGVGPR